MDLRQLQHFLTVLEHGSLKRAASDACVSQQGLSASIKALEDSLGVQLLDRGRHGAVPTAAGVMLADRAKEILGTVRLTRAELKSLSIGQTGTAVMGSGPFFAQRMVPEAIRRLCAARPNLSVRVIEAPSDVLSQMLLQGEIDFSVSTPSASFEASPEIERLRLFEDRDQPHVRPEHPLVSRATVTLKDLAEFPWIFSSRYAGDRERVLRKFATAEVRPPGQMVLTDSPGIIHELLVGHDFIHVNGSSFYSRAFSHVKVVTLEVPELIVGRAGVVMTRRGGRMAPASRALLDLFLKIWTAAATEDNPASSNKPIMRLRK